MHHLHIPVQHMGSTRVHVVSITGLSCSQISHRSKGLCEVCHHQPINAHEYSCSDGKAKTKHFSQLNTSTFFHHANLIFRQLFSSFERFCNSHPTYCITGVTEVTLNCLSQVTNPLGFSEGGSTQILPTLTARRHSPAD